MPSSSRRDIAKLVYPYTFDVRHLLEYNSYNVTKRVKKGVTGSHDTIFWNESPITLLFAM